MKNWRNSLVRRSTKMVSFWVFMLLCFACAESISNPVHIHQRSKEANCIIQGYHTCLLNSLNGTEKIHNTTASWTDCFRLSRLTSASRNNRSCSVDECPWDGSCSKFSAYNENDGFHSIEDLPISTYYEDVHTIAISYPKYLDTTALYVLETRPISANGQQASPFRFAGVSNQTTISYRVLNICERYEFRPTAIISNGSVITFLPKTTNSNPPDFIVDNIRLTSLKFDAQKRVAKATINWKHPYGYTNMDVAKYESYLHTLQCDAPSDLLNEALTDTIIKTDEGGTLTATFPEPMVDRKCQFRFMIWAVNVCGNKTLTDAKIDITLDCQNVQGYKCPAAELRPYCFPRVDMKPVISKSELDWNISVNVSWTPTSEPRPQYYHVRWGLAKSVDLRQKHKNPSQQDSSSSSEERKPNQNGRRLKSRSNSKSKSKEILARRPRTPDFSIWMLQSETIVQEKVSADMPYLVLANLSTNHAYGIQVCAIFNGDFKRPEWPKVTTNGFVCTCGTSDCSSSIQCTHNPDHPPPTPAPPLLSLPNFGIPQPPDSIDAINDFAQTSINSESDGLHMRLSWKPPKNLLREQISGYDVSIETLLPCDQAPACCDYVGYTEIDLSKDNNTGNADLFLPSQVLHSHCEFVAKITTTAINGASSVALKNILIPRSPNDQRSLEFSIDADADHDSNFTLSIPNDSPTPKSDCSVKYGCYFNLCDEKGCICPEGYNKSLDGLTCITNTPLGAAILQGDRFSPSDQIQITSDPIQNSSSNRSIISGANISASTQWENNLKRTIALSVVIPISCLVIVASLFGLLCYFYSPFRSCWSRIRGQTSTDSMENGTGNISNPKRRIDLTAKSISRSQS